MQFGNTELQLACAGDLFGYGTVVRNARDGKLCKEHCRRPQAVFPWKRTSSGPVAMSQRCQNRKWSVSRSRCVTPLIREGEPVATAWSTHRDAPDGDRVIRTAMTSLSAAQSTARRRWFSLPRQPKWQKIHPEPGHQDNTS